MPLMPDGWSVVFASPHRRECADRLLVLTSVSIAHDMVETPTNFTIVVPDADRERALYELWQYDQENRPALPPRAGTAAPHYNALPGVVAYVMLVCAFAWLAGSGYGGIDWLGAGRVDGERIREGEWWRTLTALTLHGSLRHLLGNIGFGSLFGLLAGRVAGSGAAWLVIVLASGIANGLNTLLLEPAHRSIGASTAVFAALGMTAGFVWRGRLMPGSRWPFRLGPIVGGVALLAYTGTGEEGTDIGAHLAGFLCGFAAGILLTQVSAALDSGRLQRVCGALAVALIGAAWCLALLYAP